MAPFALEIELTSTVSAAKLFQFHVIEFDSVITKVAPDAVKSVEILEGDGVGAGTIKVMHFGEAVPFKTAKHKVEALDKGNFTVKFSIIDGDVLFDIYESIDYELTFVPAANGASIFKHKAVYNCKGDAQPKEEHIAYSKEQAAGIFKAIEAYASAN